MWHHTFVQIISQTIVDSTREPQSEPQMETFEQKNNVNLPVKFPGECHFKTVSLSEAAQAGRAKQYCLWCGGRRPRYYHIRGPSSSSVAALSGYNEVTHRERTMCVCTWAAAKHAKVSGVQSALQYLWVVIYNILKTYLQTISLSET